MANQRKSTDNKKPTGTGTGAPVRERKKKSK